MQKIIVEDGLFVEFFPSKLKNIVCTRLNIFSGKRRKDEKYLGCITIRPPYSLIDPGYQTLEIGYRLNEEYRGRGIMTKVVKAVCSFIFEKRTDIEKIVASTGEQNIVSQRVLEKSGFVRHSGLKTNGLADFAFVLFNPKGP